MTPTTKRRQTAWSKKRSSTKWSPRPAGHSHCLAALRERRQEARRMKRKDSDSEVTTTCHFGSRRRLQHLANVCKLCFDICHSCLNMTRDLSSVIDHACVICRACARFTLRIVHHLSRYHANFLNVARLVYTSHNLTWFTRLFFLGRVVSGHETNPKAFFSQCTKYYPKCSRF